MVWWKPLSLSATKSVDGVPGNHGPTILSKQQIQAAVKCTAPQALDDIRHSSGVGKGL